VEIMSHEVSGGKNVALLDEGELEHALLHDAVELGLLGNELLLGRDTSRGRRTAWAQGVSREPVTLEHVQLLVDIVAVTCEPVQLRVDLAHTCAQLVGGGCGFLQLSQTLVQPENPPDRLLTQHEEPFGWIWGRRLKSAKAGFLVGGGGRLLESTQPRILVGGGSRLLESTQPHVVVG
jgi:hypothetical protein